MDTRQLRYVLRSLARSPIFTLVAILTLAVGIGANTAVFSVVHAVLLKPLPFFEPERLVGVWHTAPGLGWDLVNQSPALYFTYREESRVFEETGMWDSTHVSVTELAEPEEVRAIRVTDGILPMLGARPQLGRLFSAEDDSPGTPHTVILAHDYWRDAFGGDPAAIGKTLTVDGVAREVIAVMRPDLRFLDHDPALYLPFRFDRSEVFFGNFSYQGIARLRPGTTIDDANAEVARLIPIAADTFPLPEGFSKAMLEQVGLGPRIRPLAMDVVGDVGKVLWLLLGTVGLVLLVACANVANLMLVRAEDRHRETAIRSALGAGRGRLVGESLFESAVLSLSGGAAGLALAYAGIRLLVAFGPRGLPRLEEISIDATAALFTFGVSAVAALVFGVLPLARTPRAGLASALQEGGRGSGAGRQRNRVRNALVVAQVAGALVLLISSGLMVRSLWKLRNVEPGFAEPGQVLTMRVTIPFAEVEDPVEMGRMHENILGELAGIPGVASAGMSSSVTMDGWTSMDPIFVEDFPLPSEQMPLLRRFKWISPGYFETMGNPLLAGRAITWDDIHEQRPVAVVSENFVAAYWGEVPAALGRRIRATPGSPWREIVGVVGNVRDDGVALVPPVIVYWPMVMTSLWGDEVFAQRSMAYALRSERVGTPSFLDEARAAVWSVNRRLPVARVQRLDEILERSMARTSFTLVMLTLAAAAALLLGGIGIYGVTSYVVAQRTREIGVRMAFGARPGDAAGLVLRRGALLTGIGVLAGLSGAFALTRLMSALLYGVSPIDPLTFGAGSFAVALIALVASYVPARRAAGVDPIVALRCE